MTSSPKTFLKTFFACSILLGLAAIYQTELQTSALLKIHFRYKWAILIGVFACNVVAGTWFLLRRNASIPYFEKFESLPEKSLILKLLSIVALIAAFPLVWFVKFDFFGKALPAFFPLFWVVWWLAFIQAVGIKLLTRSAWSTSFALALLLEGIVFESYVVLQPVSDYPFSLGWSEASRYYYGSLLFSQSVYGVKLPLSIWHATRYFLLAIPFLIKGLPLWADRLWQAVLWLGLTGLTAWSLIRRLKLQDRVTKSILGGWFFLYLFQGAVYYHLQICIIIILIGVSSRHPWRSLIAVLAASFWAGMSRLNWYPVPAMLAIALYLLEEPFSGDFWRYLAKPALWAVLGPVTALLGQVFYIAVSGNADVRAFGSSLTSPLLWYRWLPNDTNSLGIIPGILLVSLPLFALLFQTVRGHPASLHPLRWLGLAFMPAVLLGGGLVVSTKMGGGGDLHNMDAYMVMLALIGAYFVTQRVETEAASASAFEAVRWPLIAFMLIVPVGFPLARLVPPIRYDKVQASKDLSALREMVQSNSRSGPVLFIYERHLLTFGMIPDVPIVQDYEVIPLMEMAISGNRPYLDRFYQDLKNHRFVAIVARKQNLDATSGDFAEESDLWNRLVAYPLLCDYRPELSLDSSNIQVFVPRAVPECPSTPSIPGKP